MDTGKREVRRRKYLNLGSGELVAAAVFAIVALFFVTPRLPQVQDRMALWSALIPLLVVLVAAGLYWLLARAWVERVAMPHALAVTYRVLSIVNLLLLAVGLVGVITSWPNHIGVGVLVATVWVFAAVEFTNYFIVRLAYPVHQWFAAVGEWRTPRLVTDMRSARR